jgi:sigma-B regulation protein RsbU (phosphoserine phosphatase)
MAEASDETTALFEARSLLDALEALGSSLDLNRTADHVLDGMTSLVRCERAHIFIRERDGSAAMVCQRTYELDGGARAAAKSVRPPNAVTETLRTGRAALARSDDDAASTASTMVAPVVGGGGRVLGALLAEARNSERYGDEELEALMSYARAAAPAIERALLYAQLVSDRRMTGELEVARQVMAGLLPSDAPKLEGFDIAAVIESAFEVGGDYYDFIPLGNDRWSVAMADVSGKGAPAALVVAALRATLYALARRELALRAILQRANEFIYAATGPKAKYVTLFYAVLDTHARRFIYINAGHLPPVVLRRNGDVELLRSGGFPLGFFDNPRYFEQFLQLESGDSLCLYTDGLTEATNANDEDYGRNRLIEVLRKNQNASSSQVCRALLSDVRHFSGSAPADDATVLVIRAT